jgi:regulator of sigma E protease
LDANANQPVAGPPTPANSFGAWFKENRGRLLTTIIVVAVILRFLHPLDFILVVLGLGGIILIHELGHFFAAKLCGVYVRTFSIGFGPAWPFCQFKYGETNYKLGMIPLGGYVAMAGESTGEMDADEAANAHADDTNPRSFKNKPVWQRMIIISAGVVMNIILAAICFIAAYLNGVKEMPPVVQGVEPGSAAWVAGIKPGTVVTKLNDIDRPWFADIPPEVSSTHKGELVHLETTYRGTPIGYDVEPLRAEGALYPQLGISFPQSVQLFHSKRDSVPPFDPDSAAHRANEAAAKANKPQILPGDTIVGMTDPADPTKVTLLEQNWNGMPGYQFDLRRRLAALAGQPVVLEMKRVNSAETARVDLPPAYRKDTGLRMKIGSVVALRTGSSAALAGLKPQKLDGEKELEPGDKVVEVSVPEAGGKRTVFTTDPAKAAGEVKLLDPLRLPFDLNRWADRTADADRVVTLTVQTAAGPTAEHKLRWDDGYREEAIELSKPGTPVSVGGLGLAYRVTTTVNAVVPNSPAAAAGLQPGDIITELRYRAKTFKLDPDTKTYVTTEERPRSLFSRLKFWAPQAEPAFEPAPANQWAYADQKLQWQAPHAVEVKVVRGTEEQPPVLLTATDDPTWAVPTTGLQFQREFQISTATGVADALHLGARRTMRAIKTTYQSLYGMVFGRISPLTMSGPITLARTSYIVAGEDVWMLVLFVALISINLAVVNFLPIPVLDGGHMVFLLYEGVRGKQPPVFIQNWLTIAGLACVLCLMLFTIGLDVWRLVF